MEIIQSFEFIAIIFGMVLFVGLVQTIHYYLVKRKIKEEIRDKVEDISEANRLMGRFYHSTVDDDYHDKCVDICRDEIDLLTSELDHLEEKLTKHDDLLSSIQTWVSK